jgi:hypothetical protein
VSFPTVQAIHELPTEVTAGITQRSVDARRPAFGVVAGPARSHNHHYGLARSDGVTPWGTAPMEVVWKAGELLYVSVPRLISASTAMR